MKREYAGIMRRLDEAVQREEMPLYEMKSLVEMSKLVLRNIAAKYEHVKEGVDKVMGGRVLEYESKSIFREGVKEGIKEGMKEGIKEGFLSALVAMIKKGRLSVKEAATEANMTVEEFENKTGLKAAMG